MNSEAQLISSLQQLSHGGRAHGLNYYYGKVKKVDKGKHTCLVHLEDEDLDVEVNLRVGQQALDSYFVTYPKMGAQILFLSEAQSFGRAYLLQCSALDYVDISACTPLNIQVGEESLGTLLSELIGAIKVLQVPTPAGLSGTPFTTSQTTLNDLKTRLQKILTTN